MQRSKYGFTLIELLVVIAIIAILAALLFPVFISAQRASKKSACLSNLKQIGYGVKMYQDDYAGYYPSCEPYPGVWGYAGWTRMLLGVYVKNKGALKCPGAINSWPVVYSNPMDKKFDCDLNYSYNEYLFYSSRYTIDFCKGDTIRYPSWVLLVSDGYFNALVMDWNDSYYPNKDGLPSGFVRIKYADGPDQSGNLRVRHEGPNVLFADLHVSFLEKEKIKYGSSGYRQWPVVYPLSRKY